VKDENKREVIWNLPFWKQTDDKLWIEGQVEVRVPDEPDYLYQASDNSAYILPCSPVESYAIVERKIFFLGDVN
jgi:hypothetical protein